MCYEMKTFLLAGHETSAAMLTWTLYELSASPSKYGKVVAEADTVYGPKNVQPSRQEVENMTYTLSCLKVRVCVRMFACVHVYVYVLLCHTQHARNVAFLSTHELPFLFSGL